MKYQLSAHHSLFPGTAGPDSKVPLSSPSYSISNPTFAGMGRAPVVPIAPPQQPSKKAASRMSGSHIFFYSLAILQESQGWCGTHLVCSQLLPACTAPHRVQCVDSAAPPPRLQMLCAVALVVIVASRVEERSQLEDSADGLSVTYTVCE